MEKVERMTELRLGDQLVRYDRDATLAAYAHLQQGWAENSGCSGCRNFIAARERAFPDEFRTVLTELGIDLSKEGEAIHYGPVEGNLHFYGGWFYFVGELIEPGKGLATISLPGSSSLIRQLPGPGKGFQYWFSTSFARPPGIFGSSVGATEFSTLIPWLLDVDPRADFRPRANPD